MIATEDRRESSVFAVVSKILPSYLHLHSLPRRKRYGLINTVYNVRIARGLCGQYVCPKVTPRTYHRPEHFRPVQERCSSSCGTAGSFTVFCALMISLVRRRLWFVRTTALGLIARISKPRARGHRRADLSQERVCRELAWPLPHSWRERCAAG